MTLTVEAIGPSTEAGMLLSAALLAVSSLQSGRWNARGGKAESMNHKAIVREYLRERRQEELVVESFPFITISREAGAGGRTLAGEIIRQLESMYPGSFGTGWEVFDQNLVDLIAEDPSLSSSLADLVHEEYRSEISRTVTELILQRSEHYESYKRIFEVIRILCTIGKCVIVGRGGVCVTQRMPLGVHIRLVAPVEQRVRRLMNLLGASETEAREVMTRQDEARRRLVRDFFSRDISDTMLYDAVFNTGRTSLTEIAAFAARAAKRKLDEHKAKLLQQNVVT
ncbi:MAG: cytidylate kinase-like family protein [Kiritimatiellae bacterium]|nr:cytidylate kinase-like family protein [Kiritimatiellia bacterium]MDW8459298.1 cytidylate kinase-like family protein [Verrucomicrobiota bacterium]